MTLGEVCKFRRGLTYSKKDEVSLSKNAVLRANNIDLQSNTLIFDEIRYISDDIVIPKSKKLVKNSVIICTASGSRSHLGKVAFIDKDYNYAFGGFMGLLEPDTKIINPRYFYTILTSGQFRDHVNSLTAGTNINNLKFNQIDGYEIVVPPISEQERIVKILDEAFEKIDTAKAGAEKNLQNSKNLFESYLQSVFDNKGDGYKEMTFEEVCELIGGSQPPKEDFIYQPREGYIRFVQVRDYRTSKYITFIPKEKARRFCSTTDIMIGRYGPPIFGIFRGIEGAYNVALMKANVNEEICNQNYFFWFLNNNKLRQFVEKSSKRAAGQDGVRKELLDKYPVFLPSLKTQQTVVYQLNTLSEQTKKLEANYKQKIADLDEFKKSLLSKAFAGEL